MGILFTQVQMVWITFPSKIGSSLDPNVTTVYSSGVNYFVFSQRWSSTGSDRTTRTRESLGTTSRERTSRMCESISGTKHSWESWLKSSTLSRASCKLRLNVSVICVKHFGIKMVLCWMMGYRTTHLLLVFTTAVKSAKAQHAALHGGLKWQIYALWRRSCQRKCYATVSV